MLLAFVGLGGSVLAAEPASAVIKLPTATTLTVTPTSNPYFSYPETYPYAGVQASVVVVPP